MCSRFSSGRETSAPTKLGRHADAIARYERASAVKPREAEPWLRRGLALEALGQPERALAAVEQACALRPKYTEGLYHRSFLLRAVGRPREAWTHIVEALKGAGEDAPAEMLLAAANLDLATGDPSEASEPNGHLALTTTFEYDPRGNPTSVRSPRGAGRSDNNLPDALHV